MIDIVGKVKETLKEKQRIYPCRSNRASQLGHPCERYLVYMRTSWDKQTVPPVEREFIFQGGRNIEDLAIQELKDAGFNPTNQGRDFEDKKLGITGHIDTMLDLNGQGRIPCEIKGISPFEFDKLDSAEDMLLSKRVWVRGYPAQLQLYLYLADKDMGLFYIKNKLTFEPKVIWMKLDYEFCEGLLKKAERINKCVEGNTLPERITDFDVCLDCPFRHLCLPDLKAIEGLEVIDSQELEDKLTRREELKPLHSEYERIDREISKTVEGKDKLSIGEFFVTGKYCERKMKPQAEKVIRYWQKKIVRI